MPRPTGGRGCKGVGTTHIRVPLPIEQQVRKLIDDFYDDQDISKPVNQLPSLEDASNMAKNILLSKRSARVSVSKLLERIYGQEVEV